VTTHKYIKGTIADGLATLSINKPPYNVLDIETMRELNAALDQLRHDGNARVLVLTGEGEKAFSAGVEVADHTPDKVDSMIQTFHGIFHRLRAIDIPVIAAINGAALGGGCELALACDMAVIVSGAKIGQPEIRLGVFPPVAAVLLPRLLSPARANELLFGGASLDALEAHGLGLVNRVFPRETFRKDVLDFAQQFLGMSRAALIHTKRAIRAAAGHGFDGALAETERIYLTELMKTEDAVEGLNSFIEKRKPQWKHR
jgi:cyclohexa-1,5-dienecarbonyl-CoA hydratase